MTDSLQPEIATSYGALDTDAILDGDAGHAHALRELARSTNRLLACSSPVLNVVFDASEDLGEQCPGAANGFIGVDIWTPLIPGPILVPKKTNHVVIDFRLIAKFPVGKAVTIQVATVVAPFVDAADRDRPGVLYATGTGDFETYELVGIPCTRREVEQIGVWIRGDQAGDAPSFVDYGGPNMGDGDFQLTTGMWGEFEYGFRGSGTMAARWHAPDHGNLTFGEPPMWSLLIKDFDSGELYLPPMRIIKTRPNYLNAFTNVMFVDPPPLQRQNNVAQFYQNVSGNPDFSFSISKMLEFTVANLAAYSRVS